MTSAYHPQADGQSEVVNKIITMYLRCLTGDKTKEWVRWLPWAEFCYNTAWQQSIRTTPFKLVYGRDPPHLKTYILGDAAIQSVYDLLAERDNFLQQTKVRLQQSQDYYSKHYDNKHTDRHFEVGDWVWLKLMTQIAMAISTLHKGKLAPKYFGPFQISESINSVTYRLELLADAQIHNAFLVSMLKKHKGDLPMEPPQMPPMHNGTAVLELELMLKSRLHWGQLQVLIKWKNQPVAESSWEDAELFQKVYPDFQLEDELIF
jgi:hypothetical protein